MCEMKQQTDKFHLRKFYSDSYTTPAGAIPIYTVLCKIIEMGIKFIFAHPPPWKGGASEVGLVGLRKKKRRSSYSCSPGCSTRNAHCSQCPLKRHV